MESYTQQVVLGAVILLAVLLDKMRSGRGKLMGIAFRVFLRGSSASAG
jgi:ribose/xylose/arabinose/galactoside ABC-type transport system permease subunit